MSSEEVCQPISVAALVYPGFTLLDLVGPHTVLSALPQARVTLYAPVRGPVSSDNGMTVVADAALSEFRESATVLLVPGGAAGTLELLSDAATLSWVRAVGERARWVTSVCSGALLLGAAGLLRGYRATSHWAVRDALALFGAIPTPGRFVTDRNRLTGGGVTAGIDFGLALAARLTSEDIARRVQLTMEYAPSPPFAAGTPEEAGPQMTADVLAAMALPGAQQVLENAALRLETVPA